MTGEELLAAGYKRFPPPLGHADAGYQLRVRDSYGTRYFITVCEYIRPDGSNVFEADIYYNDGCKFFSSECTAQIKLYGSGLHEWTTRQLFEAANEFWIRLNPKYYERND